MLPPPIVALPSPIPTFHLVNLSEAKIRLLCLKPPSLHQLASAPLLSAAKISRTLSEAPSPASEGR